MEVGHSQVNRHKNIDPREIYEMFKLVDGVNKKLGYRLFRNIYSYSLKRDFEKIAKVVETYKKKGKITKFIK